MAAVTHLGTATWTTATGNKTVTATPAAGSLIVVVAPATGVATAPVTDNNSDGLGTYTKIGSSFTGFSTAGDLSVWVRNALVGSASSTVFTATQTSSTGGGLDLFQVTGMTLTGSAAVRGSGGQSAGTAGTTPAPVLSTKPLPGNPVIGAVCNGTTPATLTQRTGYTEATDLGYGTPTTGLETMFLSSGETTATITWGSTSATAFASIAIELNTIGTSGPSISSPGQPAGVRVVLQRTGTAFASATTAAAPAPPPPATGPAFFPARQVIRARIPQNYPRAGSITSELGNGTGNVGSPLQGAGFGNAQGANGGPVRNPVTGAPFRPSRQVVRPRQPLPRRGQTRSSSGTPFVPPVTPAPFRQASQPARSRLPLQPFLKGRTASSPAVQPRNPGTGPAFTPFRRALRAALPLQPLLKGRTSGNPGSAPRNPSAGPVFRQAVTPARARIPQVFSKGRAGSNPGGPVRNPFTPAAGPVFTPRSTPARAKIPAPYSKGRVTAGPGAIPVNPATPPLAARVWPGNPLPYYTTIEAGSLTLGTQFSVATRSSLLKIWWYSPPAATVLPGTCGVWETSSQALIAMDAAPVWRDPSGTVAAPGDGWVYCDFTPAQVVLASGASYVVSVYQATPSAIWWVTAAWYWAQAGYPGAYGITHPPVIAPPTAGSVNGQGCWDTSGTWEFPGANPGNGDVFYVDAEVSPLPSGPPFYPAVSPARARIPQNAPRGRGASGKGAPVRNPHQGAAFPAWHGPVQARQPQPPRGRAGGSAGGPARNPQPVTTGPPFRQQPWPARVRPQLPRRGACRAIKFYPLPSNPSAGPPFTQAASPARIRPSLPPRGRITSGPGGPVQNPPPPVTGPAFTQRTFTRAQLPLPRRGACRAIRFGPLPVNPQQGPVFRQASQPFRARLAQLQPRAGRVFSTAAPPAKTPGTGPVFAQATQPARTRLPQRPFLKGRSASNPGAPVRNPVHGPAFRQATPPARIRPSLPPRGRIASNPGGPVSNPSGQHVTGLFNIVFPCAHLAGGTTFTLPAPRVSLAADVIRGEVGPFNVKLPKPQTSLTGTVLHQPLNLAIPVPRTTLAGTVLHQPLRIILPIPVVTLTGAHVHDGTFTIIFNICAMGGRYGALVTRAEQPLKSGPGADVDWALGTPFTAWQTATPQVAWTTG